MEAEIIYSEYKRNKLHIGKEKLRLSTYPYLTDRLNIRNAATCDNDGIAVDASYRRCMGLGLVSRRHGRNFGSLDDFSKTSDQQRKCDHKNGQKGNRRAVQSRKCHKQHGGETVGQDGRKMEHETDDQNSVGANRVSREAAQEQGRSIDRQWKGYYFKPECSRLIRSYGNRTPRVEFGMHSGMMWGHSILGQVSKQIVY